MENKDIETVEAEVVENTYVVFTKDAIKKLEEAYV